MYIKIRNTASGECYDQQPLPSPSLTTSARYVFISFQILFITKQKIIAGIGVEKQVQMTTLKIGQDMCNVSPVQGEI